MHPTATSPARLAAFDEVAMLLRIFCNLIGSQFILFIFQRLPRQG